MKEHMFYETVPSALAKGILTLNDKEMTFPLPGPSQGETRLKKKKKRKPWCHTFKSK